MAIPLPPDFKEFLKSFEEEKVDYLLIGGYAVGFYGYARATADMDVWIAVSSDNAARTVHALRRFGMNTPELAAELFLEEGKIIRMGVPPMRIEIQTGISGVDFEACFGRRQRVDVGGFDASVISLEDLKANKRAANRFKDLDDLDHLP